MLLLIVVGLALMAYEYGLIPLSVHESRLLQERLKCFLDSLGPAAFVGFILLQVVQVVITPIPGEVTGVLGGILYGPYLGVLLSTIGLTIGSYIAFALSRAFGRPFVEKFVDERTMSRFDYLLHLKGAFLVFLLFLIPGFPKDLLCYILGLGHITTAEFLVIGGTGRLFGTILLTLGGSYIRHHQYYRLFILLGIAIVIILFSMAYKDKLEKLFQKWHSYAGKATLKDKR
ncbi:MAG: TVP38/TMEM64 family protein [Nitrospirae bacterium CG_4_10_14_0_8_um_filter_41_23]|nr:TVP38/TMEM64 family protein [Nitrospirota bacterium]OIP61116.1 MAG: TVP38/TMEM64 family protein [Nitrospirae bacterium CG2_30_41_42]PIQ93800.1 MAG: TVP38/TMEM64 family protein [Nitrospirae bacterium CG11_big_fil_rev_8_21_14_0_20_41_14]PIV42401.1 MAG: TVP38/TMEM64 family protein [Nitrospirae bacterium CG02_land_8_20_14_3_00_41_53]PIW88307.1 MAG: TVP38/TMEM64 family protein [Nitrospirae bacterium CG_4_8_14_3_um_filter_41_47]PIY86120.1 MAG: TVP38/TMEM64 family protein [Nitrospirae bacterium CG